MASDPTARGPLRPTGQPRLKPLEPPQEAGRVVELVTQDAQVLQLTRQQYARYKALNWAINTHKL